MPPDAQSIIVRLDRLRTELADLAFLLESRGRRDAADVVNDIAARVAAISAASTAATDRPGTGSLQP